MCQSRRYAKSTSAKKFTQEKNSRKRFALIRGPAGPLSRRKEARATAQGEEGNRFPNKGKDDSSHQGIFFARGEGFRSAGGGPPPEIPRRNGTGCKGLPGPWAVPEGGASGKGKRGGRFRLPHRVAKRGMSLFFSGGGRKKKKGILKKGGGPPPRRIREKNLLFFEEPAKMSGGEEGITEEEKSMKLSSGGQPKGRCF